MYYEEYDNYLFVKGPIVVHKDGYIKFKKHADIHNITFISECIKESKDMKEYKESENDVIIDKCFYLDKGGHIEYISFSDGTGIVSKKGYIEKIDIKKDLNETEKTMIDCYLKGSGMFIVADEKGRIYCQAKGI